MKIKELALAATVLTLAACQSTSESNKDEVAANNAMQCEYRAKLGSNIKKRYCYTAAQMKQRKEERRREREAFNQVRAVSSYEGNN
ncbi:hypothetical protein L1077_02180 [Pseudoalteromonas luteoviolacea]|uniref:hypothetical protein n=1 Tax=Pseudoalteromonas luteoviolacea TaxID=43657 RepID=UPI001F2079A9|nr:hypothetical protein [Pseudoalteromonas luteoviolacea]MCF6438241.1 hypothetical protein [Pseudoalteromonas luteoviolacea]